MKGTLVNRNGHWSIRISEGKDPNDPTGKKYLQKWISVKGNKTEAETQLAEIIHQREHGTYVHPSKLTLGEYISKWFDSYVEHNLASATKSNYRIIIKKHIIPSLGNIVLTNLKAGHIQALENEKLESGLSHSTVIKVHNILHESLQQAVMVGKIMSNPCDGVKRCREQYKEIKVVTVDGTDTLLEKVKSDKEFSEFYPLWYTEANTGVRRGENVAIKWGKVNLDELTILIDHSIGYLDKPDEKGEMTELKEPKTKGSIRQIAITPSNATVLREYRREQNKKRAALKLDPVGDDDFVFCHNPLKNKCYLPNTTTHAWIRFTKKYGYAGVRLHDLRHSYATNLIDAGVPAAIVAKQLGHTSTRMTDKYTHIGAESLRKAAAMLESLVTKERIPANIAVT